MTNKYTVNLAVNNHNAEHIYALMYQNTDIQEYRFSSIGEQKVWIVRLEVEDKNAFMEVLTSIRDNHGVDYIPFTNDNNPYMSQGFAIGGSFDEKHFLALESAHSFRTDTRLFELTRLIQRYNGCEETMEPVHQEALPREYVAPMPLPDTEIKRLYNFVMASGITVSEKARVPYSDDLARNLDVVFNRHVTVESFSHEAVVRAVLGHAVHYYPDSDLGRFNADYALQSLKEPASVAKTPETILECYRLRYSQDIDALIVQMMAGEDRFPRLKTLEERLLPVDYHKLISAPSFLDAYISLADHNFREAKDIYRDIGDKAFWVACLSDSDILLSIADDNATVSYQFKHAVEQGIIDESVWDEVEMNYRMNNTYHDVYALIDVARNVDTPKKDDIINHDIH